MLSNGRVDLSDCREEILAYASIAGAIQAMNEGFIPIVAHLWYLAKNNKFAEPLLIDELKDYHFAVLYQDIVKLTKLSQQATDSIKAKAKKALDLLNSKKLELRTIEDITKSSIIVSAASNLPAKRATRLESVISKTLIQGAEFILEDGLSAITQSEALMWFKVNPFSPLSTGKTINPY